MSRTQRRSKWGIPDFGVRGRNSGDVHGAAVTYLTVNHVEDAEAAIPNLDCAGGIRATFTELLSRTSRWNHVEDAEAVTVGHP
jgi:hypothetical protein